MGAGLSLPTGADLPDDNIGLRDSFGMDWGGKGREEKQRSDHAMSIEMPMEMENHKEAKAG